MSSVRFQTLGGTVLPVEDDQELELRKLGTTLNEGFLSCFKVLKPIEKDLVEPSLVLNSCPKPVIIVGLSGISCGGKTTIARAISGWLGQQFGDLIAQDDYYKNPSEMDINPFTKGPEFDEPESVNYDILINDIKKWKSDHVNDSEPKVLVVEGTMIFTQPEIAQLCDLRYQLHVDFETARYRRSLRNYPIPDPPMVVEKNIWPKYIKHRNIAKNLAFKNGYIFKQIDGTKTVEHTLAGIIEDVAVSKLR